MLRPRFQMSLQTKRRCLRALTKICVEYAILPNSYVIPHSKILKLGDSPISSKDFSAVWPGVYEEEKFVAIKVMRHHRSDGIRKIKTVRYFGVFSSRPNLTVRRTFSERSQPGSTCLTRTYWS